LQLTANHSLPSELRRVRQFGSDRQRPDERLTDDCGGKTRVDGSTAGPTDRPTSIKGVAPPISLQVLLQLQESCSLHVVTCSCKSFNFYGSCDRGLTGL